MSALHHAGVCVADMEASLRFYSDGVGLDVLVDTVLESDLEPQPGLPGRSVFLLSVQVDMEAVLRRLAGMGLGGTPRVMPVPGGEAEAAVVVDPDGVMVDLLPRRRLGVTQ